MPNPQTAIALIPPMIARSEILCMPPMPTKYDYGGHGWHTKSQPSFLRGANGMRQRPSQLWKCHAWYKL